MTTLAIIGGGIAARSLLYSLAKSEKKFEKILLFYSDSFASPCSLNSTAVVAPRGLTRGLSALGDMLMDGFETFRTHVEKDLPLGVARIVQSTGAHSKLDQFKARYPDAVLSKRSNNVAYLKETLTAEEEGYLIEPSIYLGWLLHEASKSLPLEIHQDLVKEIIPGKKIEILTQAGHFLVADEVIFCTGSYTRFWKQLFPVSKLQKIKTVQGTYLEFSKVFWDLPSFSLTLEGDNLIYSHEKGKLLVGSTSFETNHEMAPLKDLAQIHQRIRDSIELEIPEFSEGIVKTGLREKASKREPYVIQEGNIMAMGGLYKNGFTLSLSVANKLIKYLT